MAYRWLLKPKFLLFAPLLALLVVALACGEDATPVVIEKQVPVEIEKEVIVEKEVIREVVKEVPVEVIKEVPVEVVKQVVKEVILVATPTPTPVQRFITSKTKRLVVAVGPPQWEVNIPWLGSELQLDVNHLYESLIGQDRFTGTFDASEGLATSWELSPEGTDWTFELRKGVPFHFGWGEFTAADVVHTFDRSTGPDSIGGQGAVYREIIGTSENLEVVNDYKIIFHQNSPEIFSVSHYESGRAGNSRVLSKAQWDKDGEDGYQATPTGTGSYQWIQRIPGNYTLAERVEDHWRKTPEFQEIQVLFTAEDATRMAGLLAGEVHIVSTPRDLQKTGLDAGMQLVVSVLPARQAALCLCGQYYTIPDKLDTVKSPWADPVVGIKIRQAMNKAINREELNDSLFLGQAELMLRHGWHKSQEGWDAKWEDEWEDLYGYDPVRAKELLGEAGYPDGFPVTIWVLERADVPEAQQMVEVIGANYWAAIGLDVTLTELDYGLANQRARDREQQGIVQIRTGSYRPPIQTMRGYYSHRATTANWYVTEYTGSRYLDLTAVTTLEERDNISREIGDRLFHEFPDIPLFWTNVALLVNPEVVAEYVFPGNTKPFSSHFEYVKAADMIK